jgi:hypothetical protein
MRTCRPAFCLESHYSDQNESLIEFFADKPNGIANPNREYGKTLNKMAKLKQEITIVCVVNSTEIIRRNYAALFSLSP